MTMKVLIAVHVVCIVLFGVLFGVIGFLVKGETQLAIIGIFVGEIVAVLFGNLVMKQHE